VGLKTHGFFNNGVSNCRTFLENLDLVTKLKNKFPLNQQDEKEYTDHPFV